MDLYAMCRHRLLTFFCQKTFFCYWQDESLISLSSDVIYKRFERYYMRFGNSSNDEYLSASILIKVFNKVYLQITYTFIWSKINPLTKRLFIKMSINLQRILFLHGWLFEMLRNWYQFKVKKRNKGLSEHISLCTFMKSQIIVLPLLVSIRVLEEVVLCYNNIPTYRYTCLYVHNVKCVVCVLTTYHILVYASIIWWLVCMYSYT